MEHPTLYESFKKHIDLPVEIHNSVAERMVRKKLDTNAYLIERGKVIKYLPFINEGLMVNYRLDENGHKHVIQIRWTGYWLGDLHSFLSGSPTNFNIQAYRPTELLLMDHETFDFILQEHPIFERFFRLAIQDSYIETLNQIFNLHSLSAQERYLHLIANCPSLLDDVPHYLIASYLGIRPQSLSRIRRELKNNGR